MTQRDPAELTPKQKAFCEEYLVDLNATAAAKRAGYAEKNARTTAQTLLVTPKVVDEINRLMKARSERTQITADRVITEVARLGFSDVRKLFDPNGALLPVDKWPEDLAAAVASVEVDELFEGYGENRIQVGYTKKVKLWDKGKALEMLGRHLKLFVERTELTGPNGGPIPVKNDGVDLSVLTDEELQQLEALRHAADSRRAGR